MTVSVMLKQDFIPSALFIGSSGELAEGTGWDPIDAKRNMFRLRPLTCCRSQPIRQPMWKHVTSTRSSERDSGGGLNQYRGVQATFEHLAAYDVLIKQPSLYIWGRCRWVVPTVPPGPTNRGRA